MQNAFASLSHVVLDVFTTGEYLGGAGLYAAIGLRMSTRQRVVLCSGVGADLMQQRADFFAHWDLEVTGLEVRSDTTPRTAISYTPDGQRRERSVWGSAHFASMTPHIRTLAATGVQLTGLYTFQPANSAEWGDINEFRTRTGCSVLWELSALDRGSTGWSRIAARLPDIDIVSVNVDEGASLLKTHSPIAIIREFCRRGASIVIVRAGAGGSYIGSQSGAMHFASARASHIVDPTGAGNAYSGAFLGGLASTGSVEVAGRLASAAASFALEQFGPPPGRPDQHELERRAEAIHVETLELADSSEAALTR